MLKHPKQFNHSGQEKLLRSINDTIVQCLNNYPHRTDELMETALYSIGSRGHRWRPFLFLTLWEKLNIRKERLSVLHVACAIEFLHTASIILDDLPSMDDASIRRGKKACHLEFGQARTILTACWLCDVAQYCIHEFQSQHWKKPLPDLENLVRATKNQLMLGQIRDLEQKTHSEKGIIRTYHLKSGVFYGFAASAPAVILGLQNLARHLEKFGNFLGIAYQISDDISDQTATSEQLGKDVHKDDSKPTLPQEYGIERASKLRKLYYQKSIAELKHLPTPADDIVELAAKIICMN